MAEQGLIPGLIASNREKKQADWQKHWNFYSELAGIEQLGPETRQAVFDNLGTLAGGELGLPKQHHGTLATLLAGMHDHLANLNPEPKDQWKDRLKPLPQPGEATKGKYDEATGTTLAGAPAYHPISDEYARQYRDQRAQEQQRLDASDANAKYQRERADKLQILKDVNVDPTSPEGQAFMTGVTPNKMGKENDLDPQIMALREKAAKHVGLKEGTPEYQEFMLTGKLPSTYGKPVTEKPTHQLTEDEAAYQAYAEEHGTTPDKLTGRQRIAALRAKKIALKLGDDEGGTSAHAKNVANGKAPNGYVTGGPSIANPGLKSGFIELGAWQFLTRGNLPFIGMGGGKKGEVNKREKAVDRAYEILTELGIPGSELEAVRSSLKNNEFALKNIVNMGAMMNQFEGTLQLNMATATKLSKLFERTDSPLLNRLQGGIERNTGNGAVDNFNLQMRTLAIEYAKIMAGQTSSTGAKIGDTEEATKLINGFIADRNLPGLFSVIKADIQNRQNSVNREREDLLNRIKQPTAGFGKQAPVNTPEPGTSPTRKRVNPTNPKEVWFSHDYGHTWSHTTDGKTWSTPQPWQD